MNLYLITNLKSNYPGCTGYVDNPGFQIANLYFRSSGHIAFIYQKGIAAVLYSGLEKDFNFLKLKIVCIDIKNVRIKTLLQGRAILYL